MIRDHYVYRAYDKDGQVLYVGVTKRPRGRYWQHKRRSAFIRRAVRWRVTGPLDKWKAEELESVEIARLNPPFNIRGRARGRMLIRAAAEPDWATISHEVH